jgi:hypothetical protein
MHHIAIGDFVLLAFQPQVADIARARLAATFDVIVERDPLVRHEGANAPSWELTRIVGIVRVLFLLTLGEDFCAPGHRVAGLGPHSDTVSDALGLRLIATLRRLSLRKCRRHRDCQHEGQTKDRCFHEILSR